MRSHPAVVELGRSLQAWIKACGRTGKEMSEVLGYSPTYLSRAFHGTVPLRLRVVFDLLAALKTDPEDFFEAHYPLGGPQVRLLRGTQKAENLLVALPGVEEVFAEERRRRRQPPPDSAERAQQAALVLKRAIERAGKAQRAVSEAIGLSPAALGLALRSNTELSFFHVFASLEQIGMSPGFYFTEVFTFEEQEGLESVRFLQLLTALEQALAGAAGVLPLRPVKEGPEETQPPADAEEEEKPEGENAEEEGEPPS